MSTAVPSIVENLYHCGVESAVAAFCREGEDLVPATLTAGTVDFWPLSRLQWLQDPALRARFAATIHQADGLHIHGLWDITSAMAARAARHARKPYVLSAHGMLEPWALANGRVKKRLYSALLEREVVRGAACLHALTRAEALQYQTYAGRRQPIAIVPNGVTIPDQLSPEPFLQAYPALRGRRLVLFLGRLHPKKGVDLLAAAWPHLAALHPDATLILAGPDFSEMRSTLETQLAANVLQGQVLFPGMLDSSAKWSALAAAECMVLPSHSEGLSMSVLEAMGAGVPVIVTPQCNMPEVLHADAGWLTAPATVAIAATLEDVLARTPAANAATGARARAFVEREHSWHSIAARLAELYYWALGGPAPVLSEVLS